MVETIGTIDFKVGDETYKTWYKVVGDLKPGVTPLVLLHGGPGMSHHYLISHTEIYTTHGIPVIFYDQIGIGASTHLPHRPKEFWTVELFMDELDNLLAKLGIESKFDLLGQSWGGMLAADYVSTRHPNGLRRLIIANAPPSEALWEESMLQHLSKFPQDFQDLVRKHEREGTTSSKEYQDALQVFYSKHTCQVVPWPEELVLSFKAMEEDPTVYTTMLGTSEFNSTGTLKSWSVIDRLHTIICPTLVVNGTEEGAKDFVIAPFLERIPKVKWIKFAKSHCPFFEDKEYYFKAIGKFLSA
ncbi:proline-specific peptidase [Butyriboletus roseoflavus]|nr:proline-specific peptidase [Butyriboletus roseoflavus]